MLYVNKHFRAESLMQRGLVFDRHVNAMLSDLLYAHGIEHNWVHE